MASIDKNIKFRLFGNMDGHTGVAMDCKEEQWKCPVFGLVAIKVTREQAIRITLHEDVVVMQDIGGIYSPMSVPVFVFKEVGIDIGEWTFGFLGDVTPKDDQKLLIIQTDSNHLLWLHFNVE